MHIEFKTIHIHHFLSFDDVELTLDKRGYCLISGQNTNPKDAAKSNGSGKSTIFNAIAYALTGTTCQGLKSQLANIAFNDGCWVELTFKVDNKEYVITRSKDDKVLGTNLKITIDGDTKSNSGKGIRESQALFEQFLPDLTSELIGSVIILGQGLPQKFTNNSPSGRKEVLEHLSKSDFMITDIKDRICKRSSQLEDKKRIEEDGLLTLDTQKQIYTTQLQDTETQLLSLKNQPDFTKELKTLNDQLQNTETYLGTANEEITKYDVVITEINQNILGNQNEKYATLNRLKEQHFEAASDYNKHEFSIKSQTNILTTKIRELKSITDICPTCGQKIPGVLKPDTTTQEQELVVLNKQLEALKSEMAADNAEYNQVLQEVEVKYKTIDDAKRAELANINSLVAPLKAKFQEQTNTKTGLIKEIARLENIQLGYEENLKTLTNNQLTLTKQLEQIKTDSLQLTEKKNLTEEHIEAINKMNTLVKRDFRGFLLTNIIGFINFKSKEYCAKIFNTDDISVTLNGNDIDIVFCKKNYDNLSGGEKQRVDLIIQFALRDMMCQHLDFSANILVLDEITDALDSVSCDKVLNFITNEINDVDSIFIISHHSDQLEIGYDSEIVVVKDTNSISHIQ